MNVTYQWNDVHSKIFSSFVEKTNAASIKYFILRNYEGLPKNNSSKDIDIIIEPGFYKRALNYLLDSFKELGLSRYYVMDYERAHCVYGMDASRSISIHIDLIEGYANKGYEIFKFEELYAHTMQYRNFKILNPSYDAVMLLLYKVVGCKELKEKYRHHIANTYNENSENINLLLTQKLGNECSGLIANSIRQNDFESIVTNAKYIGQSAKQKAFKENPVKTVIGWWKFYMEKSYNMIWCPVSMQKMIVVEAPDGTGKTTFINTLIVKIAEYFVTDISKSRVFHFRPEILPNLGAAGEKAGVMKQDKNFTVPHRAKPAGVISSFLRMCYYWMDYVVGMPLILRKSAQFDKITIFDRYIYDFLVDPRRSRISLPYWLRRLFVRLVKQPKIIFVLDTDADTIYARKQELTKEEISRQLIEFRKLSALGNRVHFLDASKTSDEIARDAMKIILDKFTKKL